MALYHPAAIGTPFIASWRRRLFRALGFVKDPIAEQPGRFAERQVFRDQQIETALRIQCRVNRPDQRAAGEEIIGQATAVTCDVAAVRAALDATGHPALLKVDGVSLIASIDFRMDEWGVGVVSRSGTLGYEAAAQMKALGIGVSTSVGIGGDPINGSSFKDVLELFEADPETHAVMMIGEIGGPQEAEAAGFIRDHMSKPVIAYVAGLTAPKGRTMGHAGAIISAFGESAEEKVEILAEAGATVAPNPSELGATVALAFTKAA